MNHDEFQKVVELAMSELPEEFQKEIHNIEIVIEDDPIPPIAPHKILLGLYQGIPLNKRTHYYGCGGVLPDKITLFKRNIEAISSDHRTMIDQIKRTLLHELGHYFGIDDKRLRELGY